MSDPRAAKTQVPTVAQVLAVLKTEHYNCPGYRIVEGSGPHADDQDYATCETCEFINNTDVALAEASR